MKIQTWTIKADGSGEKTKVSPEAPLLPKGEIPKKPWEMTREEFLRFSKDYYDKHGNDEWLISKYHTDVTQETAEQNLGKSTGEVFYIQHIKNALSEGKPIPAEVLKDYPDLAKTVKTEGIQKTISFQDEIRDRFPDATLEA